MKPMFIRIDREAEDGLPICPYCEREIEAVKVYRSHYKFMSNMHVFCCPHCAKLYNLAIVSK